MTIRNRPVRTRMPGGVGGAGSIPVPTRFCFGFYGFQPCGDRCAIGYHTGSNSALEQRPSSLLRGVADSIPEPIS